MSDPGYKYRATYLDEGTAIALFRYLFDRLPWVQRENVPRWEYWQNDFDRPYTYGSGNGIRTYEANPRDLIVTTIRDELAMDTGVHFEGCFLNRYNGENDALNWHADDDPGIDHSKPIAVISLGQERALNVRSNDRQWHHSFMLAPGSLLLMPAGSQHTHQHKIPKAGKPVGPRISLTFRSLLP